MRCPGCGYDFDLSKGLECPRCGETIDCGSLSCDECGLCPSLGAKVSKYLERSQE